MKLVHEEIETPVNKGNYEYELIAKKYKNISIMANICLIIGILLSLIFGFYIFFQRWHEVVNPVDLSNFSTFIFGLGGIFLTVASILYLIHNLRMQSESLRVSIKDFQANLEEIKVSNSNFLNQKLENTFFSLLENHYKLTSNIGIEELNRILHSTAYCLNEYERSIQNRYFNSDTSTAFNPKELYYQNPKLHILLESVSHIYLYVNSKLSADEFYYRTLWNSISECERFFIGLTNLNKLGPFRNIQILESYTKKYYELSHYKNFLDSGFVPNISIEFAKNIGEIKLTKMKSKNFNFNEIVDLFSFKIKAVFYLNKNEITLLGRKLLLDNELIMDYSPKVRIILKNDFQDSNFLALSQVEINEIVNIQLDESLSYYERRLSLIWQFEFPIYKSSKMYIFEIEKVYNLRIRSISEFSRGYSLTI